MSRDFTPGEQPGNYRRTTLRLEDGTTKKSAWICCPVCGSWASLSDHAIAADGKVTPSLVCPADGCTFHEWGRLLRWGEA